MTERVVFERTGKGGSVVSYGRSLLCAAAAFCIILSPRAPRGQDFPRPERDGAFELSISQTFTDDAKPGIVVTTSIPYRRLVFLLRNGRYEARYRVFLELADSRGKRVRGEVWEEAVATDDSRETTSGARVSDTRRVFVITPGEYEATVTVDVIDTSRRFTQKERIRIVGEGTGRLDLSAPGFRTMSADSLSPRPRPNEVAVSMCPAEGGGGARINPGALYGTFDAWPRVVFSVVTPSPAGNPSIELTARVRDTRGIILLYRRAKISGIAGGHGELCLDINIDDLPLGEYEIAVVADMPGGSGKSESKGRFTVLFNRGLLGARVGDLVDLLSLIADERTVREIADVAVDDRMRAWNEFWRKRDPTPATEANEDFSEFLQRLKYVLESFSKSKPGWRTDMGKTYMKDGAPDKIESRQEPRLGRYLQIWYYYSKGIAYIFEDAIGTGDYRLLTTEMI